MSNMCHSRIRIIFNLLSRVNHYYAIHTQVCMNKSLHYGRKTALLECIYEWDRIVGNLAGRKFSEFGKSSAIRQTKTIQSIVTFNNPLADLLICQICLQNA